MYIEVDATAGTATLEDPGNCKAFHVASAVADEAAVGAALGEAGTAEGAGDGHVWIRTDWVRAQARGRVPEGWAEEFDAMLAYAATKGWLDEAGTSIRAHIETPS